MENPKNYFLRPEILIEIALRRRWFLIVPFCLAMLVGIILVVVLPKTYTAKTLILVQPQRVPNTYVQSIVTDELSDRIRTISDQILSRTNLQKIITDFGLFKDEAAAGMLLDDQITNLRRRIKIDVSNTSRSGTASFTITFRGSEPAVVARITNALARYFIDENLKVREAQAIGTSTFLEDELASMRQRLEQVENNMKEYRERNMGTLPEQLTSNLQILERLQAQLQDTRQRLGDTRARLVGLQSPQTAAQALPATPERAAVGNSNDPVQLRAELEQLRNRYTSLHPDVIRLEKIIADLEAEAAAAPSAQEQAPVAAAANRELPLTGSKQWKRGGRLPSSKTKFSGCSLGSRFTENASRIPPSASRNCSPCGGTTTTPRPPTTPCSNASSRRIWPSTWSASRKGSSSRWSIPPWRPRAQPPRYAQTFSDGGGGRFGHRRGDHLPAGVFRPLLSPAGRGRGVSGAFGSGHHTGHIFPRGQPARW